MKSLSHAQPTDRPVLAWLSVALVGIAAPALAMLLVMDAPAPAPIALVGGPILAVGLMGTGMIAAAATGRLWIGLVLALLAGVALIQIARALGMPPLPHPFSTGMAVIVTSISFAAAGALLARITLDRSWRIALVVVAISAAIVAAAAALPGLLPDWLLALVPAQWASGAIQTALTGTGTRAASSALFALGGTAAVMLVVAWAWLRRLPHRWLHLVLLAAWLGFSALDRKSVV